MQNEMKNAKQFEWQMLSISNFGGSEEKIFKHLPFIYFTGIPAWSAKLHFCK